MRSLSTELQFYAVHPLLGLMPMAERARNTVMAGLASASAILFFASSAAGTYAYFLLPPRLWQFLAGALAGQSPCLGWFKRLPVTAKEAVLLLPLAGILLAPVGMLPAKFIPAISCVSTASIIAFGDENSGESAIPVAIHFLKLPALQHLGDVSYSLYLWHWPLLSFIDLIWPQAAPERLISLMLPAWTLAWLSKQLVEDTFRNGRSAWVQVFCFASCCLRSYVGHCGQVLGKQIFDWNS